MIIIRHLRQLKEHKKFKIGYERDFKKIIRIRKNAIDGVNEAKELIQKLYQL
jgi:hypothetical protein